MLQRGTYPLVWQVRAIIVNDEGRWEREYRVASSVNTTLVAALDGDALLEEDIYLAQLRSRAALLDDGFQAAVLQTVRQHADRRIPAVAESENPRTAVTRNLESDTLQGAGNAFILSFRRPVAASLAFVTVEHQTPPIGWLGQQSLHSMGSAKRLSLKESLGSFFSSSIKSEGKFSEPLLEGAFKMSTRESASSHAEHISVVCLFEEGPAAVEVCAAPRKTPQRMREKLSEYAAVGAAWPLAACILDPVRASVVCNSPSQIL